MVIEIASKLKKEFSWKDIIFYIAIGVFTVFLLTFLVLCIIQSKKNIKLSNLSKELMKRTSSEQELESRILKYQDKIKDFGILLDNHKIPLNVFSFLEKNTHPKIWFTSLDLNVENSDLNLVGQADNFETISQQIALFKKQKIIKKIKILDISKSIKEKINFKLNIIFDSQIFKP